MKTNVKLLSAIALIASACTTGSMVRSSSYSDDVYFTPGDNPPVVVNTLPPKKQQVTRPGITTESRQQEAGKIVDNYNLEKKDGNLESDNYVYNDETSDSDTTYESDEEAKFLINNYDDPEEISYTTRIRTFYNPYCYDPYWDSYYTPGWGFNWNMGFGGWGGGFYSGWNNPFYYGGFYDPFYSYGYGGFYPYGGYYGGYYGGGYWGGYYGGGYGGGYWGGGVVDNRDRHYGRQNYTGRGGSGTVRYSGSRGTALGSSSSTINTGGRGQLGTSTRRSADVLNGGGTRQQAGTVGSTRQAGTRYTVDPNATRGANLSGQTGTRSAETLTNLRRGQSANYQRGGINTTNPTTRQSSSGSSQNYTPTYSRPRTNTQATYNSGTTRQYARPQSSGNSGSSNMNRSYSRPQSSGSAGTVGRSYQSGSSRSSSGSSVQSSAPTRSSSSSQSYSAPSRSSSGSSYSGGGGSSSGSSSGGSSSGSGGGSGRRH